MKIKKSNKDDVLNLISPRAMILKGMTDQSGLSVIIDRLENMEEKEKLKPKKNKYRWREMKDEHPEFGEKVLVKYKSPHIRLGMYDLPFGCIYHGCRNGVAILDIGIDHREKQLAGDIQWRKMCKLPGEK